MDAPEIQFLERSVAGAAIMHGQIHPEYISDLIGICPPAHYTDRE